LFGISTNKVDGIEDGIEIAPDWFEEYGLLDTLDEIIFSASLLENSTSLVR